MADTQTIADKIRTILRRDLKLGPTADLPDSMPLIGGNMDLDSLDVLLLITNIEKEFKVKIASQDVGKEAFTNVGALIQFVAGKCNGNASAGAPAAPAPSAGTDYLSQLPHRDPFRFLSAVTQIEPGVSAAGVWSLTGREPFFAGHFPGNPLVPGVLLTEALAQLSGIVGAGTSAGGTARKGKLAQVEIRFPESAAPPAQIQLASKSVRTLGALQQFEVKATVGSSIVAEGTLTIAYAEGK